MKTTCHLSYISISLQIFVQSYHAYMSADCVSAHQRPSPVHALAQFSHASVVWIADALSEERVPLQVYKVLYETI